MSAYNGRVPAGGAGPVSDNTAGLQSILVWMTEATVTQGEASQRGDTVGEPKAHWWEEGQKASVAAAQEELGATW